VLGEPPELALFERAIAVALAWGAAVREVGADDADALVALEAANLADYPAAPANLPTRRSAAQFVEEFAAGGRAFGAFAAGGRAFAAGAVEGLVAATFVVPAGDRWETSFTSVLSPWRRKGLGAAVKAASIVALARDGARTFGTGGAAVNIASLRTNQALGYRIEPLWRSYAPAARS
jgi:GNAT superfamily N-acetyltransferase